MAKNERLTQSELKDILDEHYLHELEEEYARHEAREAYFLDLELYWGT